MNPQTYTNVPLVLVNYFKVLCQVNCCPPFTYNVEEEDGALLHGGKCAPTTYTVTTKYETPDKLIQRVFQEAYGA